MTDKPHITIKGVKDGLIFLFDDSCEFAELMDELRFKLEKSHQQLLSGPLVHVHVKLGSRPASEEDKEQIRSVIRQRGNLLVQTIESEAPRPDPAGASEAFKLMTGTIRSGQTVEHDGSLLLLGDLNPGGRSAAPATSTCWARCAGWPMRGRKDGPTSSSPPRSCVRRSCGFPTSSAGRRRSG